MSKKLDDLKFDDVADRFVQNMNLEDWRDMFGDQMHDTIRERLDESNTEKELKENYPLLHKLYKEVA